MQAIITVDSGGGHRSSVLSLTTHGAFLFSGDREGNIKVWEQASMQCVQTVQAAHEHAIMRLMVWADVSRIDKHMMACFRALSTAAVARWIWLTYFCASLI